MKTQSFSSVEVVSKFKALFEAERSKLVFSTSTSFNNTDFHFQKDDMLDDADLTSCELETSMRLRLRNRETLFLKKIDESLARIAEGTFGQCESCDEAIEFKRLEARPTTTLCLGCKEEDERREEIHIDGHKSKSLGSLRLA
ncbi:MAG: TraR/DksA family transcriptional regulator [Methylotenera sp.]|nr:TraR/DksA family transcriptional regulator [Oligoflexia bacterium]